MKRIILVLVLTALTFGLRGSLSKTQGAWLPGADPATFSDDFEDGAESPIASPWTTGTGNFNNMDQTALGKCEGTGAYSIAYVSTPSFTSDQSATTEIDSANANGPAVRIQSDDGECYAIYISSSTLLTVRHISATPSLNTIGTDYTVSTMSSGDEVKLTATGTSPVTLEVFINDASQGTREDSTYLITGGAPGIHSNGFSAHLSFSASDE